MRARGPSLLLLPILVLAACTGTSTTPPGCVGDACPSDADAAGADGAGADGGAPADAAVDLPVLVAVYDFNETAGTVATDSSGNFNNAGLIGAVDHGTGHEGGDASLRGGYVLLPPGLLDYARDTTLAAWVKVRTNAQPWQRLFDFGSGTGKYFFLTHRSEPNTLRFAISRNGANFEQYMDAPPLPTGVWKHVAVVLGPGSSGAAMYVDGQQVVANPTLTMRPADIAPMTNDWIGRSEFTADAFYDGEIDQVRIYSRALSASEIAALAAGP